MVLDHIRNRPGSKTNYLGKLDYYTIIMESKYYRVVIRRVRNKIHLVYVFAWPLDRAHFEDKKAYLKMEYGVEDHKPGRKK